MKLVIYNVPDPDPKSMYLRVQLAEITEGPWKGSTISSSGASVVIDVVRDGERVGNVPISAHHLFAGVFDALTAEMAGSVEP